MQQCHAPRLVAVTKFKTTKINFEGLFGLSTKIRSHENYPPYGMQERSVGGGGLWAGGGSVITGFYGNIEGHCQDIIRITVSEYKVYNLLLGSAL